MRPRPRSSQWLMMWITNLKGSTRSCPTGHVPPLHSVYGKVRNSNRLGVFEKNAKLPWFPFPSPQQSSISSTSLSGRSCRWLTAPFHLKISCWPSRLWVWLHRVSMNQWTELTATFFSPQSPLRNVVWIFYKKLDYSTWKWMCSWGWLRRVKLWMGKNWNRRWRPSTIGSLLWMDLNPSGWMS